MTVDVGSLESFQQKILGWVRAIPEGRYVCLSNVHMCMEAYHSEKFKGVVNGADLVIADGKPVQVAQRLMGARHAFQVRGADFTVALCKAAAHHKIPVGFYGSTPDTLLALQEQLLLATPELNVAYSHSPPFRPLTPSEENEVCREINSSGARILFVGLGCPKQEFWMSAHRNSLHCVMLGVGAAFDFIANKKNQAPRWMQKIGLEWLHRLLSEPRRLWRRYATHNTMFLYLVSAQILRKSLGSRKIQ